MKGEIRIMDKELKKLLNNYVNVIHGKAFPINPTTHQLHLLLDCITNLWQQNKKQKEVIDRAINLIVKETKSMPINSCKIRLIELLDILNEVSE